MCGEHSPCSGRAARGLAVSPGAHRAPSLRGPSARRWSPVGSPEVFRQDPGPVCRVGGGVFFSGAEFAPCPSPCLLPPGGWGGSSLEFLSPFVLRTAGGVFRPVNFPSLSHSLKKAPSDCSQGLLAGPHPKQCRRLLSVPPPLAGGGCRRPGYFSAGSCFQARNLWALFNFSSQLGCPPRSENFPQTRQREGFLVIGNFLY